jgi:hypothetical protein
MLVLTENPISSSASALIEPTETLAIPSPTILSTGRGVMGHRVRAPRPQPKIEPETILGLSRVSAINAGFDKCNSEKEIE